MSSSSNNDNTLGNFDLAVSYSTAENESSAASVDEVRPNKRKAIDTACFSSQAKAGGSFYSDKYRKLYNSVVEGHFHSPTSGFSKILGPTQIGMSIWTVEEKETFFDVLARKGRHDIKALTRQVGSKSEPEVQHYLELLRKGLVDAELSYNRPSFIKNPNIEAAFEISPECIAYLDRAADDLANRQQNQEAKIEQEKHGQMWLLTPKTGRWLEKCMREERETEVDVLPDALLLNLKNFLWLSKRYFMNSSDLVYNWSSDVGKGNEPAIMRTAFSDFHVLVVDMTKRLVQTALHIAITRLKAEDESIHRRHRMVTQQDVAACLKVLNMRGSGEKFWAGVARRCNLRVYEKGKIPYVAGKCYSHDEVEELLSNHYEIENENSSLASGDCQSVDENSDALSNNKFSFSPESEADHPSGSDHDEGPLDLRQAEEAPSEAEQIEERQEAILENLDQNQSQAEEARLWGLLGQFKSSKLGLVESKDEQESLKSVRKDKAALVDWTSWTNYGAEWEVVDPSISLDP